MAPGGLAAVNVWERGSDGPAVLCLHETGATSEVWRPLAAALDGRARTIAYDRPGWGETPAPVTYVRTTVGEQAGVAASVLADREAGPAIACGAGIGAVAALELMVRRPELVLGALLVEPPLLAFLPAATEALSEAADLVRDAVVDGGRAAALDRFQAGGLGIIGAGAHRIPEPARARGPQAAQSLFAELAAVSAWPLPLGELATATRPSVIVVGADTPPLVRDAARALAGTLARAELREAGAGLPHHDHAPELAGLIANVPG